MEGLKEVLRGDQDPGVADHGLKDDGGDLLSPPLQHLPQALGVVVLQDQGELGVFLGHPGGGGDAQGEGP